MVQKATAESVVPLRRPFHARIFRIYLDYARERLHWTDTQFDEFFKRLGYSRERLLEDSTWLDIEFADKFYDIFKEMSGDDQVAFKAGMYIKRDALSAAFYQLLRGLVSLSKMYHLSAKVTPWFTRAAKMTVIESGHEQATLQSQPVDGIPERLYICENRRGILTGLPQVYDLPLAQLEEVECFHRGAERCLYKLRWREPRTNKAWILAGILGIIGFFILNSIHQDFYTDILIFGVYFLGVCLFFGTRYFMHQRRELEEQNLVLEDSLRDNERKHRELEIIAEISRLTHALNSPSEISEKLVHSVCELLSYDRALFMIVEPERQVLKVASHFGYDETLSQLFKETEFNVRPDNTTGFFVKAVNTGKPVLIQDVEAHIHQLSSRSQKFAKILGARSFVAVPLKDRNGTVLGVLSVDYTRADKVMKPEDEDLLTTLADHIAISFHNARVLEELQKSLELSTHYSRKQEEIREIFQKFLPTDLASEIIHDPDPLSIERNLKAVRKKFVSVLFLDIVGFSKIAGHLPPEQVIDLLNTSFQVWAPIVSNNRGFVDKFTGDGFMAIFEDNNCSLNAAKASIELAASMKHLCQKLEEKNLPSIAIGMGLHYGPAILGNIGSTDRLNFTVIGDTVNLAARLESYTRNLHVNSVCVSAAFRYHAGDAFEWKSLGAIALKGIAEKTEAFELITKFAGSDPAEYSESDRSPA